MIFAYSYKLTIILSDTTEDFKVAEDQERIKTEKKSGLIGKYKQLDWSH